MITVKEKSTWGGKRKGSGRPKKEPEEIIRNPRKRAKAFNVMLTIEELEEVNQVIATFPGKSKTEKFLNAIKSIKK